MTISELRQWLLQFPQEATVRVIEHTSGTSYYDQGGNITYEDFHTEEASISNNWCQLFEYYEWKDDKKVLTLGQSN